MKLVYSPSPNCGPNEFLTYEENSCWLATSCVNHLLHPPTCEGALGGAGLKEPKVSPVGALTQPVIHELLWLRMALEEGLHDSDDKQSKTSQMELGRGWSHRAKGIMGFVVFSLKNACGTVMAETRFYGYGWCLVSIFRFIWGYDGKIST